MLRIFDSHQVGVLRTRIIVDRISGIENLALKDGVLDPKENLFGEIFNKHHDLLLDKSGMSSEEFGLLLNLLLAKVVIVPEEVLLPFREKALDIVKDIDKDDVLFVACALAYDNSIVWSDDKKLKSQKEVLVINTYEFLTLTD